MANKSLFKRLVSRFAASAVAPATGAHGGVPAADAINEAGGLAYARSPKQALAQFAATGCFNNTFYVSAEDQLEAVRALAFTVEPEFLARVAVWARAEGHMKDVPALLLAVLSVRAPSLLARVFDRVVDDAKMLRNFVQLIRSGAVGRRSLGSLPKRLVQRWLDARSDEAIFRASVGNDPSLADVIRMVHPRPKTPSRAALYGYLLGKAHDPGLLPVLVCQFENFKADMAREFPEVPFQMLTGLPLGKAQWTQVAADATWQTTRMSLNTFARHGVFDVPGMAELVAQRLRDPKLIERARAFPYQLLVAYRQCDAAVPHVVREALQDAMEVAIANVPEIAGSVYVFPDVSGSMHGPVTGHRKGATSAVRCVDVAALVAAAIVRRNPRAVVMPFSDDVVSCQINPRDSVMTNATKLASLPQGGTNCSAPLRRLNERKATGDLLVYFSDSESWIDGDPRGGAYGMGRGTETMKQFVAFKARSPRARLACIDLTPCGTSQAPSRPDVLNVGGFSDRVFDVVADFAAGRTEADPWVARIEAVEV